MEMNVKVSSIITLISAVIRSTHTNGFISSLCLNSLRKFINYNHNNKKNTFGVKTLEELIFVSIKCQFESVDIKQDEPALLAIVNLQLDCLRCNISKYLSIMLFGNYLLLH